MALLKPTPSIADAPYPENGKGGGGNRGGTNPFLPDVSRGEGVQVAPNPVLMDQSAGQNQEQAQIFKNAENEASAEEKPDPTQDSTNALTCESFSMPREFEYDDIDEGTSFENTLESCLAYNQSVSEGQIQAESNNMTDDYNLIERLSCGKKGGHHILSGHRQYKPWNVAVLSK